MKIISRLAQMQISHLEIPRSMSSGEAEYMAAAVACMSASHLRMLGYDFELLGHTEVDNGISSYKAAHLIINNDNEASIAMSN